MKKSAYAILTETVAPERLRPWVAYRARCVSSPHLRLKENESPSEGIYYIWRKPQGWDIFPYRYDEFGEDDHSELWEKYLCDILANLWSPVLKVKAPRLVAQLQPLIYGFPRGRISRGEGRKYLVLHGNDSQKLISPARVERSFGIGGVCRWERDEHERCTTHDRDSMIAALRLKETWPAV